MRMQKLNGIAEVEHEQGDEKLDPYLITIATIACPKSKCKILSMEERQVIGTRKAVRAYIENLASTDWPGIKFTWTRDSYDSKPINKKSVHIDFESHYDKKKSIQALVFPSP